MTLVDGGHVRHAKQPCCDAWCGATCEAVKQELYPGCLATLSCMGCSVLSVHAASGSSPGTRMVWEGEGGAEVALIERGQ